jgi:hypothetical protein
MKDESRETGVGRVRSLPSPDYSGLSFILITTVPSATKVAAVLFLGHKHTR